MNIKNIIKETNYNFKKQLGTLLSFVFATTIIIVSIFALQNFIDNSFLQILLTLSLIMIIEPLIGSFKYISMKLIDGLEITPRDFYYGFRHYVVVNQVITNTTMGPILYCFFGGIVGTVIGSLGFSYYLIYKEPDIIKSFISNQNFEQFSLELTKLAYLDVIVYILFGIITLTSIIFVSFFSLKRIYSFNIRLETIFTTESCFKISETLTKNNKYKHVMMNLILSFGIVISIGISLLSGTLLLKIGLNEYIASLISNLISIFILVNSLVYYIVMITVSYNIYFRDKIKKDNEELFNRIKEAKK